MFKVYPKIHRLGKDETDGILDFMLTIEEKIDGANTSIWLDEYGNMHFGSRTQEKVEGFNGFVDYCKDNPYIAKLLLDHPTYHLYGEWLVRHTISYNETAYKKFYLYDILDGEVWIDPDDVIKIADEYSIPHPQVFAKGKFTEEQIKEFVGKTNLGEVGEGVVLKSHEFINKYGNRVYAKVVSQQFKEDNAITFGGNNKYSETYWEMYVVNKYATLARVQKIMNKIQPLIDEKLDFKHTPRIAGTCYYDMITEEIWEIQNKVPMLNFRALSKLAQRKFIQIYHDILNGDVSIADTKETT